MSLPECATRCPCRNKVLNILRGEGIELVASEALEVSNRAAEGKEAVARG